jgi:hypothetical protein
VDDLTVLLIDAFKVPENDKYYALAVEGLSKRNPEGTAQSVFYTGVTEVIEDVRALRLSVERPRELSHRKSMRIVCPDNLGPVLF